MSIKKKSSHLKNAARQLFIQHGIRRVSVEEICRTASVSKVTFYKYFANKTDIAGQIIQATLDEIMIKMQALINSEQSFQARLFAMLSLELEIAQELGENLLYELYETEVPEIQEILHKGMTEGSKMGVDFFLQGQKEGVINPNFSPEFFVYIMKLGDELYKDKYLKELEPDFTRRTQLLQEFMMHGLTVLPKGIEKDAR